MGAECGFSFKEGRVFEAVGKKTEKKPAESGVEKIGSPGSWHAERSSTGVQAGK
jgi:hypothetical protein